MSIDNDIKHNPKRFWTFMNYKRNSSQIPICMTYNNLTSSNLQDYLNLFAFYFNSNYSKANLDYNNFILFGSN